MVVIHVIGSLSGEGLCTCELDHACSVDELKAEIERLEGTPRELQRLLQNGSVISGSARLPSPSAHGDSISVSLHRLDPRREKAARALSEGKVELEDLSEDLRDDFDVVLAAVTADGFSLQYAGDDLRSDRSIISAALQETGLALQCAPAEAQMDRSVVLEAVRQHGSAMQYAHISLRSDRDIVLVALEERGRALRNKAEELRAATKCILRGAGNLLEDRGFMLAAIRLVPVTFEYTGPELCADEELVLLAVKRDPQMMCFAAAALRNSKDFMSTAIQVNSQTFIWAAPHLQADPDLMSQAAQKCPEAFAMARGKHLSLREIFKQPSARC
mmetsp:Transcript_116957/g.214252  ORF Transcript_116957/g.214252 Transcript_116957/m.214252 type:complete len:330 (-) Transcript_116957:62-1051(-)